MTWARLYVGGAAAYQAEQTRRLTFCNARQQGGTITCHQCLRTWVANDFDMPFCPSQPTEKAPRTMWPLRAVIYTVTIGGPLAVAWSIFG